MFSLGTIWALFALGARLFGAPAGRAAAFLMAISPSAVFFGRFFISDTPMLFFSVAALLAWVVYLDTGRTAAAVAGAIAAALAFLVKLPAVIMLAPIAWAAWEAKGWSALKDRRLMLGLTAAIGATALWYWHADMLFHQAGLGVAIWHQAGSYPASIAVAAGPWAGVYNVANFSLLRRADFYTQMIDRIWALHLTPGGFILALIGLLAMWRRPRRQIVDVWMAVVILYMLMTAEGNRNHEYYQLPLIPPARCCSPAAARRSARGCAQTAAATGPIASCRARLHGLGRSTTAASSGRSSVPTTWTRRSRRASRCSRSSARRRWSSRSA